MQSTQKNPTELALGFLAAAFTDFDPDAAGEILAPDYIQHNPGVPTGAETGDPVHPCAQGHRHRR